jgi:hypothetical protein
MKQNSIFLFLMAALLSSCGSSESSSPAQNGDSTSQAANASEATPPANQTNPSAAVTTDDAAIAVIGNDKVRFKLHSLIEVTPDPSAPGKPAEGKKGYAADISVEYLTGHNTSPAEYMLTSYLLDDKGNKLSLPQGSIRVGMQVSEAQAKADNISGEAFNQSNPPAGQKFRGRQYGVEMDAANKAVKWGMMLDGKTVEVDIK